MNDLTKKEGGALTPRDMNQTMGGEIVNSDIVVPRIFLMQALSDFVNEEDSKVKAGDIVRSTTGEKLGDSKNPVWIIPLMIKNEWMMQEKVAGKFTWRGMEERNAKNDGEPWEFTRNGAAWTRTKCISLFGLLPKDLEAFEAEMKKDEPDLEKIVLPVVCQFRSTSFTPGGKPVATFFARVRMMLDMNPNIRPYKYMLPVSCEATENDKGKFFVFKTGESKPAPRAFHAAAEKWFNTLSSLKTIQVDTSGLDAEAASPGDDQY